MLCWVQHYDYYQTIGFIMLDDDDDFYKELPFTLTQDQVKPNFVIFGTGLQECLLAAHFSKLQMKPSLILDFDRTYGSCLKTVTIKELHALSTGKAKINLYEFLRLQQFEKSNESFCNELISTKAHRGYSIDLQPNFFFASSITCQMLKEADMDKYMDFRLVHNMLRFDGKQFKNVPLSKGKIFQSKDLGLLQKKLLLNSFHSLIQIYNKFMNVAEDQNSTKQFDKEFGHVDQKLYLNFLAEKDNSFTVFLEKLTKNNQKIMNYIIYILCNYQHNYKRTLPEHVRPDYTLQEFIKRFGKFVKSCGIYGENPYLYVDNGIGDVPQAYSRIASIYQSIYILHPRIQIYKIEPSTDSDTMKIYTNLYPNGYIETNQIFYGPTCYHLKFKEEDLYQKQYTLRVILICSKIGVQQECPSLVYLLDLPEIENPVYLFMLDTVSHTCPQKLILYQFETVIEDRSEKACLKKLACFIDVLKKSRGEKFDGSIMYATAYIRQKRYPRFENKAEKQADKETKIRQRLLRDHSGIDLDSHFINFKKVVGDQPFYFKKQVDDNAHQEDDWQNDNVTNALVEKLSAIDLNNSNEPEEDQQVQVQNVEIKKEEMEGKQEQNSMEPVPSTEPVSSTEAPINQNEQQKVNQTEAQPTVVSEEKEPIKEQNRQQNSNQ